MTVRLLVHLNRGKACPQRFGTRFCGAERLSADVSKHLDKKPD